MPAEIERLCFVLMPFSDALQEVYARAIKPACEKAGFTSLRVDELKGAFNINRRIIESIFVSDAIIADLTDWNPNVFYEMGVAHAIDNKTIMIIQSTSQLPFDVSGYNCIMYDHTETGLTELTNKIVEALLEIDEWRKYLTNPVQEFKPYDAFISRNVLESIEDEVRTQRTQIATLQKQIDEEYPSKIFLEETSLDSLLWHIRYRRRVGYKKNPVELEFLGLNCKVTRRKNRLDAQLLYRIVGTNIDEQTLSGLQLLVAGDNVVPLSRLNPRLLQHYPKPGKKSIIKPELLGFDGKIKELFLPFVSPGIGANNRFSVEFSLQWPNMVWSDAPKDYFFLDNFDYLKGTHELQIELEFRGLEVSGVRAFAVDSFLREQRLGAVIAEDENSSRFVFRRINPENERYFVLVFDIQNAE